MTGIERIGMRLSAVWIVAACVLAGCSGESNDEGVDAGMGSVSMATFNTGLAVGFVDYASERLPLIEEAVAGLDAEVVCLQEVWDTESVDAILAAAGSAFPYEYHELTQEDAVDAGADGGADGPACDEEETASLGGCVEENCADVAPENLASCVLGSCGEEFNAVSTECSNCLIANLGLPFEEILQNCSGTGTGSMAYGGRNGLLLLSKDPIVAREYLVLDSFLNRRVVLHARVQSASLGAEVDVFCTHLTANLESPEYAGDYGSWEEERAAQISALLEYVEANKGTSGLVAILGDMNCGPATANVAAEYPENYALFTAGGMSDPYLDEPAHGCTWCLDNPLVGADSGGGSSVIDHAFVSGWPASTTYAASRIFDGEVTLEGGIASRLSDHYGVRLEISVP